MTIHSLIGYAHMAIADMNKTRQQDLLKTAEEEANKLKIDDQSKYLSDQKVEVLKSLN